MKWLSPALVAALPALVSCSVTGPRRAECTSNDACREGFGLGYVCAADGYCDIAEVNPRCDRTFPANIEGADPEDVILLGSLQDLSLETKQARERAAQLAVKQINAEGGIDGVTFALAMCTVEANPDLDELSASDAAAASARWLVDVYGVQAIVGPSASTFTQVVFEELAPEGTLIVSPSASSPSLTALDTQVPGRLWRTTPPDTLQADAMATDMRTPGPGRAAAVDAVAVVHETGAYGDGLSSAFIDVFTSMGGVATEYPYSNPTQFGVVLAQAGGDDSTEVVLIAQTADVLKLTNTAASTVSFADKSFFVTDTAATSDYVGAVAASVPARLRGSRPAPLDAATDVAYSAFLASYLAEYGEDASIHSFTANSYDAAWLTMAAASWSRLQHGQVTSTGMAEGLTRVSDGPEVSILLTSWLGLVEAFADGTSVDLRGVSGELDFDPVTEELAGPVDIWVIEDGDVVPIDTWQP